MKKLGKTNLQVSQQGLGCMSMSEFYGKPISVDDAVSLIIKAFNKGVNFFDTADVYGYGKNELLIGKAVDHLAEKGISRSDIVIATKCGIIRDEHDVTRRGVDNSYSYIKDCCNKSLSRLGKAVRYIDLYYIHRISENGAQLDEAMKAMSELLEEGKIKAVGLSEPNQKMIRLANEALLKYTNNKHQITAVQSEYSLITRTVENNGVLDICKDLNITFVAYSPLSRALLTGEVESVEQLEKSDFRRHLPRFKAENLAHNKGITEEVKKLADEKKCSAAQIALAWVMQQNNVIPIPGTTKESHLLSNIDANNVVLTIDELYLLNSLEEAHGYRYTEEAMKAYGFSDELSNSTSSLSRSQDTK